MNILVLDDEKEINEKNGATREEIESALQKLGIEIPTNAEFEEKENGYNFNVDMEMQGDYLVDGNIICSYYEDGKIGNITNNLVTYEKVKEKQIKSQEEAYHEILEGKFQYNNYRSSKIKSIVIENIKLEYFLDTKGYYVPIYVFEVKINDNETEIGIKAVK